MKTILFLVILGIVSSTQQETERIGDFTYVQSFDPITDEDISYIYTNEINPIPEREGVLVWRCTSDQLEVFFKSDLFLSDDEVIPVTFRFDKDEPMSQSWSLSTDGAAAFVQDFFIIRFSALARPANQIAIRLYDYQGTPHTYQFSLIGLSRALTRLSCVPDIDSVLGEEIVSAWDVQSEINPLTGSKWIYAFAEAVSKSGLQTGRIVWSLDAGLLRFYFYPGMELKVDNLHTVTYQFDKNRPVSDQWYIGSDRTCVYTISEKMREFWQACERAKTITFWIVDKNNTRTYEYSFDVRGVDILLGQLQAQFDQIPPRYQTGVGEQPIS